VIQFFAPLMTHASPSCTANVRMEAGSDPASGSDSAKAGVISPEARRGSQRCFCSSGAEQRDGQGAELLDHQDERGGGARLGDLLHGDLQHERSGARAAVLDGEREAEDVVLGEQPAHVPRVLPGAVDLRGARADPLVDDLPDHAAELLELLRDVVHAGAEAGLRGGHAPKGRRRPPGVPLRLPVLPGGYATSMGIGTSIFLIAVGAILRFAVTADISGLELSTVGVILMVVGVLGLLLSILAMTMWADRGGRTVVRDRYADPADPRY
jgi:hypothetical protein